MSQTRRRSTLELPRPSRWMLALCGFAFVGCGESGGHGGTQTQSGGLTESGSAEEDMDSGSTEEGAGEGEGGVKFDVSAAPDAGCGGEGGEVEFSHIWIANAPDTVSKIDTEQALELARYRTGPAEGSPSRTSVNLYGDAAVANRTTGGVTKIAARLKDCPDANADMNVTTSTGPQDVKAWGQDECVLWHHELPVTGAPINGPGPRLVAWEAAFVETECGEVPDPNARLWVGWLDKSANTVHVRRLKGETGEVDAEVLVPNWNDTYTSVYGGAVDPDGNLWGVRKNNAGLVRIDGDSLDFTLYDHAENENPWGFYGIAIDEDGRIWLTGMNGGRLWRFDPETEQFTLLETTGHEYLHGIAFDSSGNAWIAGRGACALMHYDTQAETWIDENVPLPHCQLIVGIGVDHQDKVWAVDMGGHAAYRVDPQTYDAVTVTGLNTPYSYSDMTGSGLRVVAGPAG